MSPEIDLDPPPERLGALERTCLLRAAREALLQLQDEHHRFTALPATHVVVALESCKAEMECLTRGVNWLWRTRPHRAAA